MTGFESPDHELDRGAVLSAAMKLIASGDGDPLVLSALLTESGVDPARFDALFGDVQTVRYYLVLGGIAQVEAIRDEIIERIEEPVARIEEAVRRFLDFVEAKPTLYAAFRRTNDEASPIGELSRRGVANMLADLGPEISNLQGRSDMADLIAEALMPQILPVLDHWSANRARIERSEVERFILKSLGASSDV
jgi:hypothetical protein